MEKLFCDAIAQDILDEVKSGKKVEKELCIISVGHDPASEAYVKGKIHDCEYCGIPCVREVIEDDTRAWTKLVNTIRLANEDPDTGGIILQLPLPRSLESETEFFTKLIFQEKDVDGFGPGSDFKPCTPEGIIEIMRHHFERLRGLDVLLVGKGKLVGRPLIGMLLDEGCTPTICHSRTNAMKNKLLRYHDAVIFATGEGNLFDLHDVNADLVIDATIVKGKDGKLHGDCYGFDPEYHNGMKVTPVPGGVGLMTRAMLMRHMSHVK